MGRCIFAFADVVVAVFAVVTRRRTSTPFRMRYYVDMRHSLRTPRNHVCVYEAMARRRTQKHINLAHIHQHKVMPPPTTTTTTLPTLRDDVVSHPTRIHNSLHMLMLVEFYLHTHTRTDVLPTMSAGARRKPSRRKTFVYYTRYVQYSTYTYVCIKLCMVYG